MSGRVHRYRERIANWGLRRAAYGFVMAVLARTGFHLHNVDVGADRYDLMEDTQPPTPDGYLTRICAKEDLLPYVGRHTELSDDFLNFAFDRGDVCSASFYEGVPVAYKFETRHRTEVNEQLDVLIPRGFVYSYRAWTHPDHRRRGLTSACAYELSRKRYEEHCLDRVIWYVETHNYPSLLHAVDSPKTWSLLMGYVGWFKIFGRMVPLNSRWASKIGFVFVRSEDDRVRMAAGAQSR